MICFQHPRHAGLDRSLELARLLIPTFQKSHKSENPDPVLQRGGGPADAQTRVIFVLNSIRYAAASAQRLLETSSQPQSVWQQQAADALKLAVLVNKAQSECMPPPAADVLFLSLSTGLTRQRVTATLPTFVSFLLYPIIWFFSKSSIEASLGIEWALTHPHLGSAPPALQIPPSKLVSPGVLYRDGVDAGSRLPELQDEDLKRKLWQGFTEQ